MEKQLAQVVDDNFRSLSDEFSERHRFLSEMAKNFDERWLALNQKSLHADKIVMLNKELEALELQKKNLVSEITSLKDSTSVSSHKLRSLKRDNTSYTSKNISLAEQLEQDEISQQNLKNEMSLILEKHKEAQDKVEAGEKQELEMKQKLEELLNEQLATQANINLAKVQLKTSTEQLGMDMNNCKKMANSVDSGIANLQDLKDKLESFRPRSLR